MGLKGARFKGRVKIKGRPREQAAAEIMVMTAEDKLAARRRKRLFFSFLDSIIILGLVLSGYLFYTEEYKRALLVLVIPICILGYYLLRKRI